MASASIPEKDQLAAALAEGLTSISSSSSSDDLRALMSALAGKKGAIAGVKSSLGKVTDIEARKELGQAVNEALNALQKASDSRLRELRAGEFASQIQADRVDMTELAMSAEASRRRGRMHLVTQATERLEDVFVGLGFQIAEGPEVETDFYNFEALNMPPSHPARSMWDTLFIESDEPGSVVLRTHTSPVQIRVMQEWPPPIYAIMPGRVFRKETPDATHMPVFHQIEGLVIDRGITFADLAGTIESFTKAFFGEGFTSRLRPSYFPFTEPSAEFDIRRPDGSWIELGGCGMVHPHVLRAGGLDPNEWSGFAFGFGIDRMAKERHGVNDIRDMYSDDIRFTEQFS
ncbi:MAG: phenylalanine--tRNA ligase subunit alpha [Actinobacteria bacterium]|jgi:phenylalanyl-tRNA synthetase alpha chain|uniref:Phenylalanine--tRNA ligase alpha subunit n=1 Tax=freshwater metagenome TaxID=449393 RepID=A0A6J6JTE2_9ZZZZ|nr:phenylalanine--tRNA ligase subunit alpha [Actinomycetota bacterium]